MIALAVLAGALPMALLALAALWFVREQAAAHRSETRELIDRITVPEAAAAAAFARAIDAPPPSPDLDREDDERFGRVIADEFDLILTGEPS